MEIKHRRDLSLCVFGDGVVGGRQQFYVEFRKTSLGQCLSKDLMEARRWAAGD